MNRRLELPTSLTSSRIPRLKNLAASPTCHEHENMGLAPTLQTFDAVCFSRM